MPQLSQIAGLRVYAGGNSDDYLRLQTNEVDICLSLLKTVIGSLGSRAEAFSFVSLTREKSTPCPTVRSAKNPSSEWEGGRGVTDAPLPATRS